MVRLFGDIYGKDVVQLFGLCSHAGQLWAPLRVYLFEEPQQTKGHFKSYEVGANGSVLLIVLCLWERGVFIIFVATVFAFLGAILGGRKTKDLPGHKNSVQCVHSTLHKYSPIQFPHENPKYTRTRGRLGTCCAQSLYRTIPKLHSSA